MKILNKYKKIEEKKGVYERPHPPPKMKAKKRVVAVNRVKKASRNRL